MKFLDKSSMLGFGWVLLIGAGTSMAASAGHSPSVWLALIPAAIGWQAIAVLVARKTMRDAEGRKNPKQEQQDLLEEFHRLLSECSNQFSAQLGSLRGELGQVQSLLSEAIVGLTGSFTTMQEHTRHQRDVSISVTRDGNDDGVELHKFDDFVKDTSSVMQRVVDSIVNNSKLGVELIELTDNIVARTRDVQSILSEIGAIAKPDQIRFTDALPKTRSGKIMRRLLRDIAAGNETTQDTTTLEDFNVLAKLRETDD